MSELAAFPSSLTLGLKLHFEGHHRSGSTGHSWEAPACLLGAPIPSDPRWSHPKKS